MQGSINKQIRYILPWFHEHSTEMNFGTNWFQQWFHVISFTHGYASGCDNDISCNEIKYIYPYERQRYLLLGCEVPQDNNVLFGTH